MHLNVNRVPMNVMLCENATAAKKRNTKAEDLKSQVE